MRKVLFILLLTSALDAPASDLVSSLDSARRYFSSKPEKSYAFAFRGLTAENGKTDTLNRIALLQLMSEICYYYRNDFDSSLIYLNRMKSLSDEFGLERGEAWYELNLGNIYYYQDDLIHAMQYYRSSREKAIAIRDTLIFAGAGMGISDILMQWGQLDVSLNNLFASLVYARELKNLQMLFLIYDDIGNIFKLKENYDSSLIYYEKALDAANHQENTYGILVTELNLLYIRYKIDPELEIIQKLDELSEESKKLNFTRLYLDVGFTICGIYQDLGRNRDAYELYQKLFALRDSVIGSGSISKAELQNQIILRNRELENKELLRMNEVNELKIRNRLIVIFFSVFILVQAIILLIILYNKLRAIRRNILTIKEQERKIFEQDRELLYREKEMVELELKHKMRENLSKAMKNFQHNQLIQKAIDELNDVRRSWRSGKDPEQIDRELLATVNELRLSQNDQIWNEFETIFSESNPDYLSKLTKKFPNLTPNEIKLCILLFQNMRTKEITAITQQSVKSIYVARTRLRKKLGIEDKQVSITAFLRQIG